MTETKKFVWTIVVWALSLSLVIIWVSMAYAFVTEFRAMPLPTIIGIVFVGYVSSMAWTYMFTLSVTYRIFVNHNNNNTRAWSKTVTNIIIYTPIVNFVIGNMFLIAIVLQLASDPTPPRP